jgi:hypothetical protein
MLNLASDHVSLTNKWKKSPEKKIPSTAAKAIKALQMNQTRSIVKPSLFFFIAGKTPTH